MNKKKMMIEIVLIIISLSYLIILLTNSYNTIINILFIIFATIFSFTTITKYLHDSYMKIDKERIKSILCTIIPTLFLFFTYYYFFFNNNLVIEIIFLISLGIYILLLLKDLTKAFILFYKKDNSKAIFSILTNLSKIVIIVILIIRVMLNG